MFVNDIVDLFDSTCDPVHMKDCDINCLLYADDLVLLSESESGLQTCLNRISDYTKWKMKINIKKTKIMIFNKSGKLFRCEFKLGNQQLLSVRSYVYLGLVETQLCSIGNPRI